MDEEFKALIDPDVLKLWFKAKLGGFKEDEVYFTVKDFLKNIDNVPKVKVFMMSVDEKADTDFMKNIGTYEEDDENADFD